MLYVCLILLSLTARSLKQKMIFIIIRRLFFANVCEALVNSLFKQIHWFIFLKQKFHRKKVETPLTSLPIFFRQKILHELI